MPRKKKPAHRPAASRKAAAAKPNTALARQVTDAERVTKIFGWIVEGKSEETIEAQIAANWPDSKSAPLIVAAVKRIERAGEVNQQLINGWCIEAYRELYRRLLEAEDLTGALSAVKLILAMSRGL